MHDDTAPGSSLRPTRARRVWLLGCAALALAFLVFGGLRLRELATDELMFETEPEPLSAARERPSATRLSARLAELPLQREQHAHFELCAWGDLGRLPSGALSVLIVHREAKQLMLRVALDAEHLAYVKRSGARSCLVLGSGLIEHTGTYHVEAVWPELDAPPAGTLALPLWVRISAKPRLGPLDLAAVIGLGLALLTLLALALSRLPPPASVGPAASGGSTWPRALAPVLALVCIYVAMQWPSRGALETLLKGMGLFGLQLSLAWFLAAAQERQGADAREQRLRALGLTRIVRPRLASAAALLAVPALVGVAKLSLRLVPSTGEAPIETFIAWPSGMLSAALLGVLLPAGEELFFRGYLLGALLRYGRTLAVLGSTLGFGLMHAEQSWGNWGGLFAVFFTGAILAVLRVLGGSTALCAISHLAYNLTLSTSSISIAIRS